jgi:ABC-type transport system involved in multi-copper enzyme maturation permease subunit
MKIFDIALKDMTRSFRSAFALVFMFGVPLLMTGMFYLMFGGTSNNSQGFSVPVTRVVVANLDQGSASFDLTKGQFAGGSQASSLGEMILTTLQDKGFANLMEISLADSIEAARAEVDTQKAGVALIIPADFSQQFTDQNGHAIIELYKDPTLTLGPGIVQSIISQFMDNISGAKVAVDVVTRLAGSTDPALIGQVISQYMATASGDNQVTARFDMHNTAAAAQPQDPLVTIIAPIMGWLTIFYAFFTGASTAQSILREDEEGTLPRLFTTPTTQATVLGGKFLAVGLTVVVQMTVLLFLGRLLFGISWGALLPVALVTLGTILVAATFGIFINSLLKNTKQAGLIFGGLLTFLGMIGGLPVFVAGSGSSSADTLAKISLIEPVGWAVQGLLKVMKGAQVQDVLLIFAVLVAWSIAFFIIGVLRFQKRYA